MWAPEYRDQVIIPSAVPLRVTAASQHALIPLCLLLTSLIDKESAGGQIT